MSAPTPAGLRVLVAHDSEPVRGVVRTILEKGGFAVEAVADGRACLRRLGAADPPAALVLDVALQDVLVFEVVAAARHALPSMRIVLVASIYNRTSYKRRPTSLYGADDYIEQHHIPDSLIDKLQVLLRGVQAPATARRPDTGSEELRRAAAMRVDATAPNESAMLRAQRLARLIVADIALYNGDAVAAARLGNRGLEGLEARLRADIEEGRLLFDSRVPSAVRAYRDFIGEALSELLSERADVQEGNR